MRRITLWKAIITSVVVGGCATNDAVLLRQIDELRQQIAEMRTKDPETTRQLAKSPTESLDADPFGLGKTPGSRATVSDPTPDIGSLSTEPPGNSITKTAVEGYPDLYPAPTRKIPPADHPLAAESGPKTSPHPETKTVIDTTPNTPTSLPTSLPIVRLSPPAGHDASRTTVSPTPWAGGPAPVAAALTPGAVKKNKSQRADIALPQDEPLTFQTIDSAGNVHGRRMSATDPFEDDVVDWDQDTTDSEREVRVVGVEPTLPIIPPVLPAPSGSAKSRSEQTFAAETATKTEKSPLRTSAPDNSPPKPIPTASTAAALYGDGVSLLKEKRHVEAILRFEQLITDHPEHGLADNALYWKAEAYYDQQQFDTALPVFQEVITRFPLGNKVPDAMVKVGLCLQNLGQPEQARRILREVVELYPKSDAAQVAHERLPSI